jgi:hypothetical protein
MNVIEGVAVSNHCDYSFGDQSGCIGRVPGAFMKQADPSNPEFAELANSKEWMTVFIDNIRLYNRPIRCSNDDDQKWVDGLQETNDLLKTCAEFPNTNFIIFTNLEDTPITEDIHDLIPENVKGIFGVNAIGFGGKVHPFPYGVQRIIHPSDNRIGILHEMMERDVNPSKLLYINHAEHTNISERGNIREKFEKLKYATVDNRVSYDIYCQQILNHKFMICPQGNGVDCHRNWEVLYLKRVPIMKRTLYLEKLFDGYPILWVNDYAEITKTLLTNNEYLYDQARNLDNNLLDLYSVFNRAVKRAKNS